MIIREATKTDLEQWSVMRTQLWPDTTDGHVSELEEYFSGESIDIVQAYVLEHKTGEIVGFIELNIRNFVEGSRSPKLPYVEAWYVRSSYRGHGYGKQLMEQAEHWALEQGFRELASDTEIGNNHSIAVHNKLGFRETERIVCFLKKLK